MDECVVLEARLVTTKNIQKTVRYQVSVGELFEKSVRRRGGIHFVIAVYRISEIVYVSSRLNYVHARAYTKTIPLINRYRISRHASPQRI